MRSLRQASSIVPLAPKTRTIPCAPNARKYTYASKWFETNEMNAVEDLRLDFVAVSFRISYCPANELKGHCFLRAAFLFHPADASLYSLLKIQTFSQCPSLQVRSLPTGTMCSFMPFRRKHSHAGHHPSPVRKDRL